MSLEQRLIDTLHRADDFEPSPDLFARVERSLDEDLRHRRRVRWVAVSLVAGAIGTALFLRAVISVSSAGRLVAPGWALEIVATVIQMAVLLTLGPAIRRFGQPLVADVFRLDPAAGNRFLNLLDIAYYLFFVGLILMRANLDSVSRSLVLGEEAWRWTESVAVFLLYMGLAHTFTIAVLPLIGLFFSSLVRRARRNQAGPAAPPVKIPAEKAERVVRFIIWGFFATLAIAIVVGVGLFLLVGVFGV
ncbi:MAG: hypothetical protein WD895_02885 [Acidimicrobiia bacterium]